ncbi:MAG: class I adenylate-forming enzyme family protein [Azospirillaceae bacterium]
MLRLHHASAIHDPRTGRRLDAPAFDRAVEERCGQLEKAGLAPGHTVAIRGRGSLSFFVDLFAAWRRRSAVACLSPSLTAMEIERLTGFVGAGLLLDEDGPAPVAGKVSAAADADSGIDRPALLLFTSGTTGEPKTVVLSYRALLARVALNAAEIGADALASTLNVLPVHFGHGLIGNCLTPLLTGGTLYLFAAPELAEIGRLGMLLTDHRIRFMSSVPSFWTLATRLSAPPERPTLRRVHVGSAPLSTHHWRQIVAWAGLDAVFNVYGITEAANWIGGGRLDARGATDGYVGRMWGGQWAVAEPDGTPLLADGEGEVLVASPALMSGYFRRPDLTAKSLLNGWFRTGDIGRLDAAGRLTITGRLKDEINVAGIKVHPEEVDLLLGRHEAVAECCCFAEPDPASGERVAVAVVPAAGVAGQVDGPMLSAWMAERIRRECIPVRWYFLTAIPRSDRGKVNRAAVRDFCRSPEARGGSTERRTP